MSLASGLLFSHDDNDAIILTQFTRALPVSANHSWKREKAGLSACVSTRHQRTDKKDGSMTPNMHAKARVQIHAAV